jgi:hypothetical protein
VIISFTHQNWNRYTNSPEKSVVEICSTLMPCDPLFVSSLTVLPDQADHSPFFLLSRRMMPSGLFSGAFTALLVEVTAVTRNSSAPSIRLNYLPRVAKSGRFAWTFSLDSVKFQSLGQIVECCLFFFARFYRLQASRIAL